MNKRWTLVGLAAAVAIGSWAVLGSQGQSHAQESGTPPPPAVTVAQTLVRPVSDTDAFTGRLQAVDTVAVHPRVSGYVTAVHFKEGARVRQGDLLFTIDPRPYQAEVDRLAATLNQAQARIQKLAASNAGTCAEAAGAARHLHAGSRPLGTPKRAPRRRRRPPVPRWKRPSSIAASPRCARRSTVA